MLALQGHGDDVAEIVPGWGRGSAAPLRELAQGVGEISDGVEE